MDNFIDFETYSACRTADVIMVDPCDQQNDPHEDNSTTMIRPYSAMFPIDGREAKEHTCGHYCVRSEFNVNLTKISLFRRPIVCGWKRNGRYYRTPCGLDLYSYRDIAEYLAKTQSKLRIDSFDFSKTIDPSANSSPSIVKIAVS